MKKIHIFLFAAAALPACDWSDNCIDDVGEDCPVDTELCVGAGETGSAECIEHAEPVIDGETVACRGVVSDIEVLGDSAAQNYGVTDYAFESQGSTYAGLVDFMPIPVIDGVDDPWYWPGWWLSALPGVVTHEGLGQQWAGYFGRLCCDRYVTSGILSSIPENSTCAAGGLAINHVNGAWCHEVSEGAGFCVHPCAVDDDCPSPANEFCDLSRPDPNGQGPGVCRYKSMPSIPTPHAEIGN